VVTQRNLFLNYASRRMNVGEYDYSDFPLTRSIGIIHSRIFTYSA
jgi:hypothetical protein